VNKLGSGKDSKGRDDAAAGTGGHALALIRCAQLGSHVTMSRDHIVYRKLASVRLDCNFISALQHWFGGAGSACCEYLDVSQNPMTSIAPMSFPRVHTLAAMFVPIAALPCMRRCFPALTELRLDGCHVTSAAIAKAFEECGDGKAVPLRVLSVSGCPLASLRPLQHLSNLEVTPAYFGALNPFCIQRFSPPTAVLQEVIARNCRMGEGGGGGDSDAARLLPPPPPAKSWPALQILQVRF
jgi:hypothetical protein